jgi:molecular chaperone DnaJ
VSTKEWLEKDYYATLGVSKDASATEIKKAFRKLAQQYHPDSHPDDKAAEAKFKEISEAYAVLGDEKTRKEYDEARQLFGSGGYRFTAGPGGAGPDLSDILGGRNISDLLGGLFGQGFSGFNGQGYSGFTTSTPPPQPAPPKDTKAKVKISFADAALGTVIKVRTSSGAEVKFKIPAGTQNGKTFRAKGKGVGGTDLLITVQVEVPKHLSDEAQAKLREFAALVEG